MRVLLARQLQVVLRNGNEVLPVVLGGQCEDVAGQPLRKIALPRQQEAGAPSELGDVAERTVPRCVRALPRAGVMGPAQPHGGIHGGPAGATAQSVPVT
jgi:hypothetical protein